MNCSAIEHTASDGIEEDGVCECEESFEWNKDIHSCQFERGRVIALAVGNYRVI